MNSDKDPRITNTTVGEIFKLKLQVHSRTFRLNHNTTNNAKP